MAQFDPFGGEREVLPPPRFTPLPSVLPEVKLSVRPRVAGAKGGTAAQKAGRRYEAKVFEVLSGRGWYIEPVLTFGGNKAVPDALYVDEASGAIIIAEVKSSPTIHAFLQLRDLYIPLVWAARPGWEVTGLGISPYFDVSIALPKPHKWVLVDAPEKAVGLPAVGFWPAPVEELDEPDV